MSFGKALRISIAKREYHGYEDYASLIELEYAEKPDEFIESLKKFLRRYDSNIKRYERETGRTGFKPNEGSLIDLMQLVDKYGVRNVSSAIITHALVRPSKEE